MKISSLISTILIVLGFVGLSSVLFSTSFNTVEKASALGGILWIFWSTLYDILTELKKK